MSLTRYPHANWKGPIPNLTPKAMVYPIHGLVLHIEQGSESGTNNWFHNPAAQASAHFGNPKTGPLDQWVDLADKAWAEVAGNSSWFSVEHEGYSGQSLTPSQIENDAHLFAWICEQYPHVKCQITDDINGVGLGWHGMGGAEWGGHVNCPGTPIVHQRGVIVSRAKVLLAHPATV